MSFIDNVNIDFLIYELMWIINLVFKNVTEGKVILIKLHQRAPDFIIKTFFSNSQKKKL